MYKRLPVLFLLITNLATCVAYCGATSQQESTYRLTESLDGATYTLDSGLTAADCVSAQAIAAQLDRALTCERESR